jgi:hypothetical protein
VILAEKSGELRPLFFIAAMPQFAMRYIQQYNSRVGEQFHPLGVLQVSAQHWERRISAVSSIPSTLDSDQGFAAGISSLHLTPQFSRKFARSANLSAGTAC